MTLTAEEQVVLTALVHQRRVASKHPVRAQCLLAMVTTGLGWTHQQTARAYAVRARTWERLRQRAGEAGVKAAPPAVARQQWPASQYTGEGEARLAATACVAPPAGQAHWTRRRLAERQQCVLAKGHSNRLLFGREHRRSRFRARPSFLDRGPLGTWPPVSGSGDGA